MKRQKGFTIIEVVLVLAVAALILLMVFTAWQNLQKSERDGQRQRDMSNIVGKISQYGSATRGAIPSTRSISSFVTKYLSGNGTTAGDEYTDPTTGAGYSFTTTTTDPTDLGIVNYRTGVVCGSDGAVTSTGASTRNYALRIKLESQAVLYCVDNHS